jgi:hypothetical protein
MTVGEPLHGFRGVLTGVPVYTGELAAIVDPSPDSGSEP